MAPDIAFLGFAERAELVRDLGTTALKWNVLGLKNILLLNFYPWILNSYLVALAMKDVATASNIAIRLRGADNEEIGGFNLGISVTAGPLTESDARYQQHFSGGWSISFLPFNGPPIVVLKPGSYRVSRVCDDSTEEVIGEFYVTLVNPPPLTPERVAAIKSNPHAVKAVRAEFGCKGCSKKLRIYAALERNPSLESEGFIWYADIADNFECACGKTKFDTNSLKANFFAPIGYLGSTNSSNINFIPLYEQNSLENLRIEFLRTLDRRPPEEEIQKFMERNPILLHQFPAERLFFKPAILTHFKADFGIVTPQKELILVEIEKPGMRLLKKDGDRTAQLSHAFDQVHNWLHVADEHRLSVLDDLKISRDLVGRIRGVVIAGRDLGHDANHLRRLKGSDGGRVSLLTYDDLALGLAALARDLTNLQGAREL